MLEMLLPLVNACQPAILPSSKFSAKENADGAFVPVAVNELRLLPVIVPVISISSVISEIGTAVVNG
jgi:hypothetical protein